MLSQGKPPLELHLIFIEYLSGTVTALVTSFLLQAASDAIFIRGELASKEWQESIVTSATIASVSTMVTAPLLTATIVMLIGSLSTNYEGSFWWALLGAYLGQSLSFGLGQLASALDQTKNKEPSRMFRLFGDGLLTSLGAVLLYNIFRKAYPGVRHYGSLLHWKQGLLRWGLPLPLLLPSPASPHNPTLQLTLFSGSF